MPTTCYDVFAKFVSDIQGNVHIVSESDTDKEFHFQNWVQSRLGEMKLQFGSPGRNTYPDFRIDVPLEGYEVKGLNTPGRINSYDSNSQVPSGKHDGREIFYTFGLYPKDKSTYPKDVNGKRRYPIQSLIICHGDFLNADHDYVHLNDSVKSFGTYGDILIRDRKMYVPPTPFALTNGTIGFRTLIVPARLSKKDERFNEVGRLVRIEAMDIVTGYSFDLENNILTTKTKPNPSANLRREFVAYRLKNDPADPVTMKKYIPPNEPEN